MSKVKFNPFTSNKHSFEDMIDNFFNSSISEIVGSDFIMNRPNVNVFESEKDYQIELAAPGLEKSDFHIDVEKEQLIVEVKKEVKTEKESTNKKFTRREFDFSSFRRSFHIPETVNVNAIKASYTDGILRLSLPKKEEELAASRKITIA